MFNKIKKALSLILCALLILSIAGCTKADTDTNTTPKEEESKNTEKLFTPGTYEGVGAGRNGDLKVEVVVDDSKILSVKVVDHSETPALSDAPIEEIPLTIVEGQSLNVDIISGATVTSNAVLEAVKDALTKAGGDLSKFMKEVDKEDNNVTAEDAETDIVVVGSGAAGMAAALRATYGGKSVIVVEKLGMLGGGDTMLISTFTRGAGTSIPAELEAEGHTTDDLYDYVLGVLDGKGTPFSEDAIRTYVDRSGETIDWLVDLGVPFAKFNMRDFSFNTDDGSAPGPHMVNAFKEELDKNNVDYRINTRATSILMEDGKAVGVEVEGPKGSYKIKSDAVILATGGFSANSDLLAEAEPAWLGMPSTGTSAATGDGIIMAREVGADIWNLDHCKSNNLAYILEDGTGVSLTALRTYIALVNHDGQRFVNEGHSSNNYKSLEMLKQKDGQAYAIFDQTAVDNLKLIKDYNDQGYFYSADTLEELADLIDVNKENFLKTMEDYRAYAGAGEDKEFGRKITDSLEDPKFYAALVTPSMQTTHGGVKTDDSARVISTDGTVIPGLYAAGSVSGHNTGTLETGGASMVTLVFGQIAGETAVADLNK